MSVRTRFLKRPVPYLVVEPVGGMVRDSAYRGLQVENLHDRADQSVNCAERTIPVAGRTWWSRGSPPLELKLNGLGDFGNDPSPCSAKHALVSPDLFGGGNPRAQSDQRPERILPANPRACRPGSRGWGYKSAQLRTILRWC